MPYILEAIEFALKEVDKLNTTPTALPELEDSEPLDFEEKKRRHNKKLKLQKGKS